MVELLLVLAIIGTLMSLMLAACWSVLRQTRTAAGHVSREALELAALSDTPLHVPSPPLPSGEGNAEIGYIPNRYLIAFQDTVADPAAEAERLVAAYAGGKVLRVYNGPALKGCNVFIPGVTAGELTTHAGLKHVQQEARGRFCADLKPTGVRRITSTNPEASRQKPLDPAVFGLPNVNGSLVRSTTGKTIVALLDTGVDKTHPDLNVTRTLAFGYPIDDDSPVWHGTGSAGIIGAKANGQGIVGVYPGVELWSLKMGDGFTNTYVERDLVSALEFVLFNAGTINVANMPVLQPRSSFINGLVDACVNAGVIMVTTAGGRSSVQAQDAAQYSPASASQVVCAGVLVDTDGKPGGQGPSTPYGPDDSFATFSNFGPAVRVLAPGVDIILTSPGNQYRSGFGSSLAAAHISGLLALYHNSTVTTPQGARRRATGLEIVSLLLRTHGAELIPGPDGRLYPLLTGPGKKP